MLKLSILVFCFVALNLILSGVSATEFVFQAGDSCELTSANDKLKTRYGVKIFDFDFFESGIQYATGEVIATNTRKTEICFSPRLMNRTAVTGDICFVNVISIDSNQQTIHLKFDGDWNKKCLIKAGDLRDGDLLDMNSTVDEVVTEMVQERIDSDETLWSYLDGKIKNEMKGEFRIFRDEVKDDITTETYQIVKNSSEIAESVKKLTATTLSIQNMNNSLQKEMAETKGFIDQVIFYSLLAFILFMGARMKGKDKRNTTVLSTGGN